MLIPAALIVMYSAECTVGQIAHKSSEICRLSEICRSLLPESPRLTMQDGSPTVIVGPKLLLSLSSQHASCFASLLARRLDSGSGRDGGAATSAMTITPASGGTTTSANWLPEFPYSSRLSSPVRVVHPPGTEP